MGSNGTMFSDSHCHLDKYQPKQLAKLLERAKAKCVDIIVGVGMTLESSEHIVRIAQSHEIVLAAVGIHPWCAVSPAHEVRRQLRELAKKENVVSLGEIGLDYASHSNTKKTQRELFIYQLSLARESGLPVNIHCREAHEDMMCILREEGGSDLKGMIHGFSGDEAVLEDWLDLGFYVSVGVRGFLMNKIPSLQTSVRHIPSDRLLTETDSAFGGQIAGPVDVISVIEKLAEIRGATAKEIGNAASANLKRFLGIL